MDMSAFLETRGQSSVTTAKVICNRLTYSIARKIAKMPQAGWLYSRWHWYRSPFSLRHRVLWSSPLQAWFCPEDESAMECMLRLPSYEPVGWVSPKPGDVFIDVGAYIGWYTIQAARDVGPSGRVVAMEPDPSNRRQLEVNLSLNDVSNCTVVPLAVWSEAGDIGWQSNDVPVWSKVGTAQTASTVRSATVDSLASDLALPDVRWIKMDIEGAEIQALQGAEQVLKQFHPNLFIEVHETLEPVSRFLKGFGYTIEKSAFDQPPDRHGWILAR
jgi:FkbM family methyltransferase